MWWGFFKDVHPLTQNAPILARSGDCSLAFDDYQDDLTIACGLGCSIPRLETVEREADIAPARTFRGDLVNLATCAEGFSKKIGHVGLPSQFSGQIGRRFQ